MRRVYYRLLLNSPSVLTSPVMHCQWYLKYLVLSLTRDSDSYVGRYLEKCALRNLMRSHVIDFETSDSSKVTLTTNCQLL